MGTSVVSPATTVAITGMDAGILGIVAIATLILLLVVREAVGSRGFGRREDPRMLFLSKVLTAPILALLAVFATIVVVKIWEVL
ncbi:MAG TPA: hypothetical protein HA326_02065 [Thermoplasmata archaeon]|nr:hypothetical protein [Thermoplasmata archaeon]